MEQVVIGHGTIHLNLGANKVSSNGGEMYAKAMNEKPKI